MEQVAADDGACVQVVLARRVAEEVEVDPAVLSSHGNAKPQRYGERLR